MSVPFRIMLLLGALLTVVPIAAFLLVRVSQEADARSVQPLRATLDSIRGELRGAETASDSARLIASIRMREQGLSKRDYHLARRRVRLAGWWAVPSMSSGLVATGLLLLLVGIAGRRRSRAV